MIKHLVFFIIFLLVCVGMSGCASRSSPPPKKDISSVIRVKSDVLFIASDYADALAFKALLPYLRAQQVKVNILAFGAAESVLVGEPAVVKLTSLLPIETGAGRSDKINALTDEWKRSPAIKLPDKILDTVVQQLDTRVVVTGMVHAIQAQLTNQLALKGAYSVAFYDNFDLPETQAFIKPWLATTFGVNELFLPSDFLIHAFLNLKPVSSSEITVVGRPALESWMEEVQRINKAKVLQELSLKASEPVVVFIAGDEKDSLLWLEKFLDVAAARTDIQVIIGHHHEMQGISGAELEKKVQALNNVRIAPKMVSSEELASIANLLVTHKSAIGMKAAYTGIPVLYVAELSYRNILTEHHLAMRASSWSAMMNAVHRLLDNDRSSPLTLKAPGMPSQPVVRFNGRLLDILKGLKQPSKMPVLENVQFERKQLPDR